MTKESNPDLQYLAIDDNHEKVQVGSSFTTADATGTPKTSPLTVSSTEIAITVPDRAVEVIFAVTGADIRVSEVTGMANYYVIPEDAAEAIGCARMPIIYVKRNAAVDATLNFRFTLV